MSYRFTINACDGVHTRTFKTEASALKALVTHLGYDHDDYDKPMVAGRRYYDDFGSSVIVEELPRGVTTARQTERLRAAYDARECGIATKAQLALLERTGF